MCKDRQLESRVAGRGELFATTEGGEGWARRSLEEWLEEAGIFGLAREVMLARQEPNPEPYAALALRLEESVWAVQKACSRGRRRLMRYLERACQGGALSAEDREEAKILIDLMTPTVSCPRNPLAGEPSKTQHVGSGTHARYVNEELVGRVIAGAAAERWLRRGTPRTRLHGEEEGCG